jgi:hypothetical protein
VCVVTANPGRVVVANGDTLTLEADQLSNLAGNTLTGGYWEVNANSTLNLGMDNPIATLNAPMVLNGSGAQVLYYDTRQFRTTSLEQTLRTVGTSGVLVIENGRAFNDSGALTVNRQVALSGGTLSAQPIVIDGTGLVSGSGTIAASAIYDSGHVLAQGGQLVLNAPLIAGSPAGNALIAPGATLTANGAVGVPIQFQGTTGTLVLAQARAMAKLKQCENANHWCRSRNLENMHFVVPRPRCPLNRLRQGLVAKGLSKPKRGVAPHRGQFPDLAFSSSQLRLRTV